MNRQFIGAAAHGHNIDTTRARVGNAVGNVNASRKLTRAKAEFGRMAKTLVRAGTRARPPLQFNAIYPGISGERNSHPNWLPTNILWIVRSIAVEGHAMGFKAVAKTRRIQNPKNESFQTRVPRVNK